MTDEDLNYSSVPLKFVGKMECRAFGSQNKDHALIKQLGEALKDAMSYRSWDAITITFHDNTVKAIDAYNNWKRERGE